MHSAVIVDEVVDEAQRRNKRCLVFKVDYEKAYDSVCWEFLSYMMNWMGFCTKWIDWIEAYLKSTSISILVNESPIDEFFLREILDKKTPWLHFCSILWLRVNWLDERSPTKEAFRRD